EVNGIQGLKIIKQYRPETHVIMLTVFDQNEHVFDAMCAGANGYLLKKSPPAEIINAIDEVMTGGAPMTPAIAKKVLSFFAQQNNVPKQENALTPKETEVLKLLVDGFSYKMIAAELEISIDTVRSHIKNIYRKLQVNSMTEAVAKAIRQRLV
ncbi:MAG: response regulator transcription factor, partial [Flavobacteriales bacterium]|nr:response regulator transcription factor [Flavobacteriales bacterium]